MQGSVTVRMNAPADRIWELVSDVTRIGRYSPETFEAEWLGGATGPAVGARFRGHVRRNGRGPTYWTECQVTECVPGKVFAFAVETRGKPLNTWRYEITPVGSGDGAGEAADVTESYHLAPALMIKVYWAILGWARGRTNEKGMRATLERVKADAESPAAG